ncbi:DNA polymerase-1 [Desulfurella multipotens]|uniref:DNA polymerase I n=1 Tax=Desulfurella multipotens TaxID=79269 RepID=A0A1G6HNK8_9BACT|nr:DNA polymerase [Desulfurella multipotens]SDB95718.1 DNA polymerase-1 [Desulfurella multipotens]
MKEKVYLIDGSSFLYRFFYAIKNLSYNNFPTSVIFGFARLLLSLKDAKYILICFDSKEKTFRKELFDDYKKQRPPIPDDLAIQIEPTKEIIKAFGVKYLELAGFEADDIIATLANKFKKDFDVVIVTQDKDLFQLVDDNVFIFDPVKNITYDYKKTIEKFGVKPQQISDLLALAGDSSDGIPGVENIGPKTAVKLLTSYGDINSIIKNKDRLPQKIKENIDEEKLKLYKSLTILDKNINFDNITIDSIKKSEPDLELLTKLFKQYNFKSLMDKLVPNKNNNKNCNQANLFDEQLPSYQTDDSVLLELAAYLIQPKTAGNIDKCALFIDKGLYEKVSEMTYSQKVSYLKPIFLDFIKKLGLEFLLFEVELPLSKILKKMEKEGIGVDIEKLKQYRETINKLIQEKRSSIESITGSININSPKELQVALFEKLGLKPTKKNKTGFSTDSDTLEQLDHPVAKLIIEYRILTKLLSTYIEPLIKNADKNNRIHTTFNQTLTLTGRLSSSNPNMQNLPLDNPFVNIREAIVAKKDFSLICADYSQIELRVLAELSKDPILLEIFKKDLDIHTQTAVELFNILPEMVDSHTRRIAKTINFGIIYGMGAQSLAKTLSIPAQKASEYIQRYFERFSKAKEFIDETLKETKNLGYTQTYFNRRRYFENINSPNKKLAEFEKRAAVNAKIQGTAADIIKIAMVKLDKALENFDAKIILQIHDELLIECSDAQVEEVKDIVKNSMEKVVNFEVPLKVNIGIGKNWHEAKT